jgi:hypothetical protein
MSDGGPGKFANAVTVTRGANMYDEWVEGTITLPLRHLVSNLNNRIRMLIHSNELGVTILVIPIRLTYFPAT